METIFDSRAYVTALMKMDKTSLPPDGGERFNRLIFARSPYLLQHAENPVNWYEWGDAAFEKARAENLPVLLSIGYATCHWCHVMAHESFEDSDVAALLNRHFVCIKVDREERPDIDDFYMAVSQLMTGSGGWPLNIIMTPDKHPFFAMTYLPKQGRQGVSGLMELMANIAVLWRQNPDRVELNSGRVMESLAALRPERSGAEPELQEMERLCLKQLGRSYDHQQGGFGSAPKFPMPPTLSWLIRYGRAGDESALEMALHTLRKIRRGGIWDQLGGGLHRYSVDREWLAPHFEKMLYDQAMCALAALDAFQASGDQFFRELAESIFMFVERDLTAPEGGFYSALDADSEGVEGKCYLWDIAEVEELLGPDAALFCSYYDISAAGNFEGRSILHIPLGLEEFCDRAGRDPAEVEPLLARGRARLLKQRATRIQPLRDEKIIAGWNGLMIAALAGWGAATGNRGFTNRAERAARFIRDNLRRPDGRLLRCHLGQASDVPAFLEDYAFFTQGLIALFEATLESAWLDEALRLADDTVRLFRDPAGGDFGKTGHDAEQMPLRATLEHDGVIPSPFPVAAMNFIRLGRACSRPDLLEQARLALSVSLEGARQHPAAQVVTLQALTLLTSDPVEIRLRGRRGDPALELMLQSIAARFIPTRTLRFEECDGSATALVCALKTCHPPVHSVEELDKLLARL